MCFSSLLPSLHLCYCLSLYFLCYFQLGEKKEYAAFLLHVWQLFSFVAILLGIALKLACDNVLQETLQKLVWTQTYPTVDYIRLD